MSSTQVSNYQVTWLGIAVRKLGGSLDCGPLNKENATHVGKAVGNFQRHMDFEMTNVVAFLDHVLLINEAILRNLIFFE